MMLVYDVKDETTKDAKSSHLHSIKSKLVKEAQWIYTVLLWFLSSIQYIILSIIATCPVRFEFYYGEEELKYTHNIAQSLVTAGPQIVQVARYRNLFIKEVQPIMKEHEGVYLTISKTIYENYGSIKTTVLQTLISWLHKINDPFVAV